MNNSNVSTAALLNYLSAFCFFPSRKRIDPTRFRTWNPLIRSQMPYPLGHGATHWTAILLILKITISSIVMVYKTHNFLQYNIYIYNIFIIFIHHE